MTGIFARAIVSVMTHLNLDITNITSPALLVDKKIVHRNIGAIVEKCRGNNVRLRPHFKTHQSEAVGELFREAGVQAITVSSISMGMFFAQRGWRDITVAFPLNRLEIGAINRLAALVTLHLLVEAEESVHFLEQNLSSDVHIWIEVDTGYHRSGIEDRNREEIKAVARAIRRSTKLHFEGLLTHSGHSYNVRGKRAMEEVYRDTAERMVSLKNMLVDDGCDGVEISVGDTPTCSMVDELSGTDEIRCGNFVYYDLMQYFIGACRLEDIAVALACPVVGVYPRRGEFVLYGGAVHLSKEYCLNEAGDKVFGFVCRLTENGWQPPLADTFVRSVSQEHGIVTAPPRVVESIARGDLLAVLPVHSCLAANLMKERTVLI